MLFPTFKDPNYLFLSYVKIGHNRFPKCFPMLLKYYFLSLKYYFYFYFFFFLYFLFLCLSHRPLADHKAPPSKTAKKTQCKALSLTHPHTESWRPISSPMVPLLSSSSCKPQVSRLFLTPALRTHKNPSPAMSWKRRTAKVQRMMIRSRTSPNWN
jgi:hypothetical protein